MAILKTVLMGTHTNTQQIIAEFNTRVLNENPIAIVVQLNLQMISQTIQNDFVLDSQKTTRTINLSCIHGNITGKLSLDEKNRAVIYDGAIVIPNNVNVGLRSGIVSIF